MRMTGTRMVGKNTALITRKLGKQSTSRCVADMGTHVACRVVVSPLAHRFFLRGAIIMANFVAYNIPNRFQTRSACLIFPLYSRFFASRRNPGIVYYLK